MAAGRQYVIDIGPRPSAIFFSSLLSDGLKLMKEARFKPPIEPLRWNMALADEKSHQIIFKALRDAGLF